VRTIDVGPTVLAVAGLPVPPTMLGGDLRHAPERTDGVVSVCPRSSQLSIESGGWKLITTGTRDQPSLFHLTEDPRERTNLAKQEPGRMGEMLAQLVARVGPVAREHMVDHVAGVDPATRQQLQALGYLD
jgi:arylsulfatase A-like enzyme